MITKDPATNSGYYFSFRKDMRAGEILTESHLITTEILDEALEYQIKYGGNTTQYFLKYGFVTEEELVHAISSLTGCPYLALGAHDIPREIIGLVSAYIAEKYWLIPVDKISDVLTVVMSNPCDERVIQEIELMTHCRVQPFVGFASDIAQAIERHYHVDVNDKALERERRIAPLFIREKSYRGLERRKTKRIKRC